MANWSRPAIIEELTVNGENFDDIDLSGGFAVFEYFESLFSPHITANLIFVDTGGSASGASDVQELSLIHI